MFHTTCNHVAMPPPVLDRSANNYILHLKILEEGKAFELGMSLLQKWFLCEIVLLIVYQRAIDGT